ncbi:MAG: hypothetical protein IPI76_09340 [Chloracidobacterium sp.]|nr:hypothetical protein [Chloracidobacterium sp.]MBK7803582.1 hypothetical protein [Chloracidobacterium sp.]MBK9766903.1 hypothetical protein [Chloracidobacterium sp.]MBL0241350.1 hypothetical protein [Chloracidobacterium sp.]
MVPVQKPARSKGILRDDGRPYSVRASAIDAPTFQVIGQPGDFDGATAFGSEAGRKVGKKGSTPQI